MQFKVVTILCCCSTFAQCVYILWVLAVSHLSSALCATLWRWGPSVCGGGWSTETESGRSAASCSAPTASSPGPTQRKTTCRCLCVPMPCDPTDPDPLQSDRASLEKLALSSKLKLCEDKQQQTASCSPLLLTLCF